MKIWGAGCFTFMVKDFEAVSEYNFKNDSYIEKQLNGERSITKSHSFSVRFPQLPIMSHI